MWRRLQALWRRKLALTVAVNVVFWTAYSFLGRHAFFELWTPPRTWLDAAIPFQPEPWAWVYLSQFLITATVPWLIDTLDMLRRYIVGLACLNGVSFAVFLFVPVAAPRVTGVETTGAMAWILEFDGALNAFPSLHAGFLIYLARLGWRMSAGWRPWWAIAIGSGWGAAILYATIATRQHYVVDLIAGAAIGLAADWLAWRNESRANVASTMSRQSGVAFQDGCK